MYIQNPRKTFHFDDFIILMSTFSSTNAILVLLMNEKKFKKPMSRTIINDIKAQYQRRDSSMSLKALMQWIREGFDTHMLYIYIN